MPSRPLFDVGPGEVRSTNRTLSCVSCGLYKGALSPKMAPHGDFKRGLMAIGEAPGEFEDKVGKPWQGRTGKLLKATLAEIGVDLDRDGISLNSINCRPPKNRVPSPHEQACCAARIVDPAIARFEPRVILLLGGAATASVVGGMMPEIDGRINKWRGWKIPAPHLGAWLCPTFHPSYVAREEKREVDTVWEQDLRAAVGLLDVPVPKPVDYRRRVRLLRGENEILAVLGRVESEAEFFSHDYETTGLRASLQKLVCASFATSADSAYAFMWDGNSRVVDAWRAILSNPRIGKISHNLKFEESWAHVHLGVSDIKWSWDSMLAAHVIDNRVGLCGLKLQTFLNFGVLPYDTLVSPFLESVRKRDPASPNRIYEFIERHGADELLCYCGLDSLFAFMLMERQREVMVG